MSKPDAKSISPAGRPIDDGGLDLTAPVPLTVRALEESEADGVQVQGQIAATASTSRDQAGSQLSNLLRLPARLTPDDSIPWLASAVVHAAGLLILALVVFQAVRPYEDAVLEASFSEDELPLAVLDTSGARRQESQPLPRDFWPESDSVYGGVPVSIDLDDFEPPKVGGQADHEPEAPGFRPGGGLQGRGTAARAKLVEIRGGNEASEAAVGRALRWLMAHQLDDGSWRFDLTMCPQCRGACRNSGDLETSTAATGLALLCFLGAGQTHVDGEYQDTVNKGLYYLTSQMILTEHGGDLHQGTMYAQGIATIALCEAYGMSGDPALKNFAQQAVDFIVYAQHGRGGWRYHPGQPGDTTVTGWQLMALKSATLAGLDVPSPTLELVRHFLDSVQSGGGAFYGYQRSAKEPTNTAIGLLCRMYLGWPHDHDALRRGVEYLAYEGPSPDDMYHNYYTTMTLHHYEGPSWPIWNEKMRDYLIETQDRDGHEAGSWHFDHQHAERAGRLYNTAMATMILEVYYRYMPLYSTDVLEN